MTLRSGDGHEIPWFRGKIPAPKARTLPARKAWVSGAAYARTQDSSLIDEQPSPTDYGFASATRLVDEEAVVLDQPLPAFLVGHVGQVHGALEVGLPRRAWSKQHQH